MVFNHNFSQRQSPRLKPGYDFNPVEGFQEHKSESIQSLLNKYASGDIEVGRALYADDDYPFDQYQDKFDVLDSLDHMESENFTGDHGENSESSDSGASEQPLGNAQEANDNPGDSEISSK